MQELINEVIKFRDERDWKQFHTPKDLVISLSLEAAELLELFQWKDSKEAIEKNKSEMADELADILVYCLTLCNDLGFSPEEIIKNKLSKNAEKYPIEKSYGSNKKYNEL